MSAHSISTRQSEPSHPTTHPPPPSTPAPPPSSPATTLPPLSQIRQTVALDRWNGDKLCYDQIDAVLREGQLTPQKVQWIIAVLKIIRLNLEDRTREMRKAARELEGEAKALRGDDREGEGLRDVEVGLEEFEWLGRELAEKARRIGQEGQRLG